MNRKALDVWSKLGSGEKKDHGADGLEESVQLLSEISDIEIITEFSPWIYKANRNRFKVRPLLLRRVSAPRCLIISPVVY
jgi:hypothetical protein